MVPNVKAILLKEYGGLDGVFLEEVPVPDIAPNEVLIRVKEAAVNPLEVKLISGHLQAYFPLALPYHLGTDLAGSITRAGALVSRWREGDQVIGMLEPGPGLGAGFCRGGAFAEFVAVPAHQIAAAPAASKHGAGLPIAAGTAWQALFEIGGLRSGQRVLIHAGAGGVGSFAIQLAKRAGAHVSATASANNLELLRELGADVVIDYRAVDFGQTVQDMDLVLDTVGGDTQTRSFKVLRQGGLLVTIVSPPDKALADQHGVRALWFANSSNGARLGLLSALCDEGALRVVVDRIFPLSETKAALAHSASGHAKGKILIANDQEQQS